MGRAKSGISVKLEGFEEYLQKLEKAGKDVDTAAQNAVRKSASIAEQELRAAANAAQVPSSITKDIRTKYESNFGKYSAEVGWEKGNYNSDKPSSAYKAIFLNFGTVRRQTKAGKNRGQIANPEKSKRFITVAKRKASSKIKQAQKEQLEKALEELK
ncbi:MAG: hypothetical protein II388_06945 [Clostridia bacterium]|nr:hypothetical protein [Clostridia bacterium]